MTSANVTMTGSYDYALVAVSVLIAMFASYAALDLAGRVTVASGWARSAWLTGGSAAMGFGIWSMHYLGMLAFSLPVPVGYDWPTVLLSLLASICASAVALYVVSRKKMVPLYALAGSVILGVGIAAIHYIGMAAMRLAAICRFNPLLVILSVLLAIVFSLAALWLAFHLRNETEGTGWRKIGSALVMGAAITAMHYTGMASASFVPSSVPPDLSHAVTISVLGIAGIATVTFIVLSLAVVTSLVDRRFYAQARELESSEQRYRLLFERSLAGVHRTVLGGHILDCNDAYSRIFGFNSREEQLSHREHDIYLSSVDREAFAAMLKEQRTLTNFERCLRRKDNNPVWVLENATFLEGNDGAPSVVEGTLIDITARKRAETELRQANGLLETRQREIEEELLLAARVQQSLAPSSLTWGGVSVETFYQPVRTIGGDFGLVAPRADCLSLLVCDVSGHGIGSALVANRIYTETMAQIELGVGLGSMMRHLNRFVMRNLGSSDFYFTLVAARLNRGGRSLEFAGAGHPPAMIVQPGETPRLLESQSAVLGLLADAVDGEATIEVPVEAGDRVVIYTDGFTESFNSQEEMLGVDGFSKIVCETSTLSLPNMKQELIDRVAAWRSGPAADDMSLVVVGIS
jgi:PAS domain S-box-containing protein